MIEVDDEGVGRDYGVIPPQGLVIFVLVVVEPFLGAELFQQRMPIHNTGGHIADWRWHITAP